MADTQTKQVGLKFSPEFLQLFTDLASMDLKTRTTAGTELLRTVIDKQTEFEKVESKSSDHCPELQYTVKRLCKGLASSRDGARQGFATVLTEVINFSTNLHRESLADRHFYPQNIEKKKRTKLFEKYFLLSKPSHLRFWWIRFLISIQILKTFASVSTKYALDTIMAENEVKGKEIKGKAPREQLFGRIFGLATLARSKRLEVSFFKSSIEKKMYFCSRHIFARLMWRPCQNPRLKSTCKKLRQ